ncbi:MAG: KpsF/GutQ family sugar-phosphate isomerase [Thermodesulfobacteriota bacterium]|nr:KpsF/GutQ family sugar-phosphate isomerase [Thermodesulfobacteriota bacterium]
MVIKRAREVLKIEAEAIKNLIIRIDKNFTRAVDIIYSTQGRVIIMGVGKSGIIGRKIAATLTSTGTPALFLHPVEGMHGDLGIVMKDDVVLAISNSGETEEVISIIPILKRLGARLIVFTGKLDSTLARNGDVTIDISVEREACPLGLAPTASTTATLAMGDALAVALLDKRSFQTKDFHRIHPGGNLGERLMVRIKDVMLQGKEIPIVNEEQSLSEAINEMTNKDIGLTLITDNNDLLTGIITDGDLRRIIQRKGNFLRRPIKEVMTRDPKTINEDKLAGYALEEMERHKITALAIVDEEKHIKGIVHLHDLLGKGEFKFRP